MQELQKEERQEEEGLQTMAEQQREKRRTD